MIANETILAASLMIIFMVSCNSKKHDYNSFDNNNSVQNKESIDDNHIDIPLQFGARADAVPKNDKLYTLVDNFIGEYELTKNHILLFVVKLDSGDYEVMTQRVPSRGGGAFLLLKINNTNIEVVDTIFYDN